ncbi:hypothetical protein SJI19_00410 [Acerihabitans sp. TG2]|uniref:hypothetical protein n=1 Tax=Acerihabitans sp. TG2 TaxID=3096008 RepID=UPI002B232DD1|nr:hypothetical protein [Acerihabitans sp. TG2]MEA9389031.1 hypothetical protein [Acerihabitans sp. TG2]
MALEQPYLPQAENNIITGTLISQTNAVQINVRYYNFVAEGDVIRFYWGSGFIGYINVPNQPQFPLSYFIPANLLANGTFTLRYSVEDAVGNISFSPSILVTIFGHTTPKMVINAEILVDNALANGERQNRIRYTVSTLTRATGATEDFSALNADKPISITGTTGVNLSPLPYQTDPNGQYELGITSQSWGIKKINASLDNTSNHPKIETEINFLVNYRFDIKKTNIFDFERRMPLVVGYSVAITLYDKAYNQRVSGEPLVITGLDNNYHYSGATDENGTLTVEILREDINGTNFQVALVKDTSIYETFVLTRS